MMRRSSDHSPGYSKVATTTGGHLSPISDHSVETDGSSPHGAPTPAGAAPAAVSATASAAVMPPPATTSTKLMAALFYAGSSLLIVFVNKFTLSVWEFPSFTFLAVSQFVATVVLVRLLKALGVVDFPDFDTSIIKKLFPLPLFFFLNVLSGLGGTQRINVAMFTVLRRFSILMTLILNWFVLNRGSLPMTKVSVALMILGAVVAAGSDLTFDLTGFVMVLLNDLFTAAVGVTLEKKLDAKELNKWGLMYYNSLFSIPILFCVLLLKGDEWPSVLSFTDWFNGWFVVCFSMAACMGVVLQLSIFVCTQVNSALTTSVVGCLKNVLVAYLGILGVGGGFVFSWLNFIGINISIFGSLVYAYVEYNKKAARVPHNAVKAVSSPPANAANGPGRV